jgi:hypothetical protein
MLGGDVVGPEGVWLLLWDAIGLSVLLLCCFSRRTAGFRVFVEKSLGAWAPGEEEGV